MAWPSVISLRAPSADPASLLSGNLEHMQNRLPPGGGGMDANPYSSYRKNVAICPRGHRAPFFQYNLFSAFRKQGQRDGSEILGVNGFGCCAKEAKYHKMVQQY